MRETHRDRLHFTTAWSSVHRLKDGTNVHLRLLRPSDGERLVAGFNELSPESRYRRFFSPMPKLPDSVLQRLLDVDDWDRLAIAADTPDAHGAHAGGVGIARFFRLPEHPDTAEAAVAVVDHMHGRGLGKLLLSTLAAAARERGITTFRAEVLRTNNAMISLLEDFDGDAERVVDGEIAVYHLDLPPPAEEQATPLFDFLRLAARGLEILGRRLAPGEGNTLPPGGSRTPDDVDER